MIQNQPDPPVLSGLCMTNSWTIMMSMNMISKYFTDEWPGVL